MIQTLILKLHEIGAIQFGQFFLKSGISSPIYLDLRLIVSYPKVLETVAICLWNKICHVPFDLLCGVPYAALPIATAMSLHHQCPMIMRRKEVKEYGTKKGIEGIFKAGQQCLLIEDIITSGSSLLETIEPLKQAGLKITDIAIVIDREQGGVNLLKSHGYTVHPLMTMTQLLTVLQEYGKIEQNQVEEVLDFIHKRTQKSVV